METEREVERDARQMDLVISEVTVVSESRAAHALQSTRGFLTLASLRSTPGTGYRQKHFGCKIQHSYRVRRI